MYEFHDTGWLNEGFGRGGSKESQSIPALKSDERGKPRLIRGAYLRTERRRCIEESNKVYKGKNYS